MVGTIGSALISAGLVLACLGGFYLLLKRKGHLSGPEETEQTTAERMEKASPNRSHRLGMTDRVRSQTPMVKGLMVLLVFFSLFVGFNAYRLASTGTPSHMVYMEEFQTVLFGTVLVGAGTWFQRRQDGKVGEAVIKYEDTDSDDDYAETIYFDRESARRLPDGSMRLPEMKSSRFLGLFWTPKLVADDPERRHADDRLPTDQVIWEVPGDGSAAWHEHEERVVVRAKDYDSQKNDPAVDYRIVPSDRKSAREVRDLMNDMEEMEQELKQSRLTIAVLTERLEDLRAIAEQREEDALETVRETSESVAGIYSEITGNLPDRVTKNGGDQTSAIPTSGDGGD